MHPATFCKKFANTQVTCAGFLAALLGGLVAPASAADFYWDGLVTPATWGTASNWSTNAAGTVDATRVPNQLDMAYFNTTPQNNVTQQVNLTDTRSILGLVFNNTGSTVIQATTANQTLTLGAGGLTTSSSGGTTTIGSNTVNQGVNLSLVGAQTWNLGAGSTLNLNGLSTSTTAITRGNAMINFTGTGTLGGSVTTLNNNATTGIIGGFATYGDDWAVHAPGGAVTALNATAQTAATITTGFGSNVHIGTTTTPGNISMAAGGVTSIYTLRVTDTANRTLNIGSGNVLALGQITSAPTNANGGILLASGAGTLTIGVTGTGTGVAGSMNGGTSTTAADLYITNNSTNAINVNSVITNSVGYGGGVTILKGGTGALNINSSTTSWGGSYIVQSGTLKIGSAATLGVATTSGSVQYGNNVTVNGGTSAATAGVLDLNGNSVSVLRLQSVGSTFAGKITSSTAGAATITSNNANNDVFNGVIENGAGIVGLTRVNTGTLTLGNANTYTGATTLGNGTFIGLITLDFNQDTAPVSNIVSSGSALVINTGTLTLNSKGGNVANTQTFAGTTITGGARITNQFAASTAVVPAGSQTIDLGTINRSRNATLEFVLGSNANTTNTIVKTTAGAASGFVADASNAIYMSFGDNFAVKTNATTISAASTVNTSGNTLTTGTNLVTNMANNVTWDGTGTSPNALLFNNGTAFSLNLGTNTLRLANGAIMIGGSNGANSAINGGFLQGTAGGSLNVFQRNTGNFTIGSVIGNNTTETSFIKAGNGSGAVILTGANTYTGTTTVNGGTLQVGVGGVTALTGQIGTGDVTIVPSGILRFSRSDAIEVTNKISVNGLTTGGTTAGLQVAGEGSVTFSGNISGTGSVSKTTGLSSIVTLSGNNTYTGATIVNAGRLNVTGSINTGRTLGGDLIVGNAANTKGIVNLGPGGSIKVTNLSLGSNNTVGHGAVYQTGGTLTSLGPLVTGSFSNTIIGSGSTNGGYGYYKISGGVFAGHELQISNGQGSVGVLEVTGGQVSAAGGVIVSRSGGTAQAGMGMLNVSGGGSVIHSPYSNAGVATGTNMVNFNPGLAYLNVTGGYLGNAAGGGLAVGSHGTANQTIAIANMNAGVVQVSSVTSGTFTAGFENLVQVNFNGGTLKATQAGTLISSSYAPTASGVTAGSGTFVHAGGATIDSNNYNVTSAQALLAPTGNGVSTISITGAPTGLIGAPIVILSGGGGAGATAVANMVDDGLGNGTFTIGSITVTNEGTGYVSTPNVTIVGNATAAPVSGTFTPGSAVVTTTNTTNFAVGMLVAGTGIPANTFITAINPGVSITLSRNTNATASATNGFNYYTNLGTATATTVAATTGGLTKIGLGTLTFSGATGANTYTGATTINGGGVTLDYTASTVNSNLISSSSALTLSGGTLAVTGKANTTNSQTFASTTLNGGNNVVTAAANATGNPLAVNVGAVTRTSGTVNFNTPVGVQSASNGIITTNTNDSTGIMATWATANGTDYAAVNGTGNIVAYAGYDANNNVSTWASTDGTKNYSNTGTGYDNATSITGTVNAHTVSYRTANASNINIGSAGVLSTDGILVSSGVGAFASQMLGGTLRTTTAGGELIVMQNNANGAGGFTISSNIANNPDLITSAGSKLTKGGAGLLVLTGTNTYTGATTISGGVLRAIDGTGISASSNMVINGGTFELRNGGTFSRGLGTGASQVQITGGISGFSTNGAAGTINLGGAGTSLQWGSATFNPATGLVLNDTTANNTLLFQNGLDLNGGSSRTVYVNASGAANAATISGSITNSQANTVANFTKGGVGTLILTGTNSYDGVTAVSGGTLQVGNGGTTGTLGTGSVQVASGATLIFNRSDNQTLSQQITIAGTVQHATSSTLTLSAVNNNIGGNGFQILNGGTLDFGSNTVYLGSGTPFSTLNALVNTVGTVNASGGVFYMSQTAGALTAFGANAGTALVINASLQDANQLSSYNTSGLQITGGDGIVVLNGANTYTGITTIGRGVLSVSAINTTSGPNHTTSSGLGAAINEATGIVNLGAGGTTGTLRYTGVGETTDRILNLAGNTSANSNGGVQNDGGFGALVFTNNVNSTGAFSKAFILGGTNTADNAIRGIISNNSSTNTTALIKDGSGKWILSGSNTYTGTTTVRGGTLVMDYSGAGNTSDPLTTGAVLAEGGNLVFRGKTTGVTTETVSNLTVGSTVGAGVSSTLTLEANGGSGVQLTTSTLTSSANLVSSHLIDMSSSASNSLTAGALSNYQVFNGVLMALNGGQGRANLIVKNDNGSSVGYGFATLSGATSGTVGRLVTGTTLTGSSSSGTTNYFYNTAGTLDHSGSLFDFQTLTVDATAGDIEIAMGAQPLGQTTGTSGRGILVTGDKNVSFTRTPSSTTAVLGSTGANSLWFHNYSTGMLTIEQDFITTGASNVVFGGTGLTNYTGTIGTSTGTHNIYVESGIFRMSTAQTINQAITAPNLFISSGGVLEIGADLNVAGGGDFVVPVGIGGGQLRMFGNAGFSAYSSEPGVTKRVANLGGTAGTAGPQLVWGTSGFLTNPDGTDGNYTLKLSSAKSNATIELENTISLNQRNRVVEVADGSASTDAQITYAISGGGSTGTGTAGGIGGLTKTGTGTLALKGANTYQGGTSITAGSLLVNNDSGSGTGSGAVQVGNGLNTATLGGTGTVISTGVNVAALGALSPGDAASNSGLGVLNISGPVNLNASGSSILNFQVSATSDVNTATPALNLNGDGSLNWGFILGSPENVAVNNDTLNITGLLSVNATGQTTVNMSTLSGPLVAGMAWDLMDWGSIANSTPGSYNFVLDPALTAALGSTLGLDTSRFYDTGYVGIYSIAVPEPGRAVLLLAGLAALVMRRRRKMN